ncbi:MAG: hypothetical protein J6Q81_02480, partial [Lentisphaeria bacterium]|nr:hypothetical protein [Lentisphaeria bacterium]
MRTSYLVLLFAVSIFYTFSAAAIDGKSLWKKSVSGRENLAAGKVLNYSPAPSYRLTVDAKDNKDLTDGKLSKRPDDRIWFDRNAVGWRVNEIYMMLDLGEKKDLDKAVMRTLGGAPRFPYPDKIETFVSNDGKFWYRTGSLSRLQPGEMAQHDNINFFYYDESSPATVPLYLNLQASARYILIKVTARGFFFTDELAVLPAEKKNAMFNDAFKQRGEEMPLSGFIAKVRTGKLAMSNEFFMPQFFEFSDLRAKKSNKSKVELVLELPEEVEVYNPANTWSASPKGKLIRWSRELDLNSKNLSYTGVKLRSKKANFSGTGFIYATVNGKEQFKSALSIETLKFPEFKEFEKLHVSLAWIGEAVQMQWPDFFKVWKRLGFNAVSSFPLHRQGKYTPDVLNFFEQARQQNFKHILNLSATKELERTTPKKAVAEVACTGKKPFRVCPSYFGSYWQKECDRLTGYVKLLKPDYVFFDIEGWGEAESRTQHCKRCNEGAKKAGVSRKDFLLQCGKRHVKDLHDAVAKGAKSAAISMPEIGSYDRSPAKAIYQITRFSDEYPKYTNMAQPSLYVAGNAEKVHNTVRFCAEKMNFNKKLIVFLTAGTYGEYDSEKLEMMILECFLNGAGGITYFNYRGFDTPADYFYHAKALAMLRPYEELIANGKQLKLQSKPANAMISAL